jgi:hypothetical protein
VKITENLSSLLKLPIYPFLFALYPGLALLGHNIEEVRAGVAGRALLVSLLASVILLITFRLILKKWDYAAILTTAVLITFFSYGHIYTFLKDMDRIGDAAARHRFLIPISIAVLIALFYWLRRVKPVLKNINSYLNLIAFIALIVPLYQIASYSLYAQAPTADEDYTDSESEILYFSQGKRPPDVYYIILDAYSRDDDLLNYYALDNSSFLNQIAQLGFFVANCSQGNYAQTQLSLASSLNYDYLDKLSEQFNPRNQSRIGIHEFIQHSKVRKIFEKLDYDIIAFETGFKGTEWDDADFYFSPSLFPLGKLQIDSGINGFELMLMNNSAILVLIDASIKMPEFLQPDFDNPRRIHRDRILYALDQLSQLPTRPGPKFVFAHLVIPHPPYVFGPDGEFRDYDQENLIAYRDQLTFLNRQLIPLLEAMIIESETPPIIILQADHGGVELPPQNRMNILNAYYLPENGYTDLYNQISPVNTFRVIFNRYFNGQYEILDDVSLFSVYKTPFDYTQISDNRPGCQEIE